MRRSYCFVMGGGSIENPSTGTVVVAPSTEAVRMVAGRGTSYADTESSRAGIGMDTPDMDSLDTNPNCVDTDDPSCSGTHTAHMLAAQDTNLGIADSRVGTGHRLAADLEARANIGPQP